jgi:hypothetical protein
MLKVLTIADAIGIAYMAVVSGKIDVDPDKNHATATCKQFPIIVRYAVLKPTLSIVREEPLTEIAFAFTPLNPPALPLDKPKTKVKGVGRALTSAISPVFVDFYEKHRHWLRATFGSDTTAWPPLFNFARMLRNFISHTEGRVHFDNPKAAAVTWHHLSYSPVDEGKAVMGYDIDVGDLIVLMFELSDELDRLGCSLNP